MAACIKLDEIAAFCQTPHDLDSSDVGKEFHVCKVLPHSVEGEDESCFGGLSAIQRAMASVVHRGATRRFGGGR